MNSHRCFSIRSARSLPFFFFPFVVALAALLFTPGWEACAAAGKTFASPEEAVTALAAAVNNRDIKALSAIFGPSFDDIESPDPVQRTNELAAFAAGLNASNHITLAEPGRCILETGEDRWPFPIPIVRRDGAWFFDTESGKQEVMNRRIGRNELRALQSIRAAAEAEREYASADRNGDEVLEFAQKIFSTPGTKDGLYWPPDLDGEISPLGPAFARAQSQGYFKQPSSQNAPEAFHGYFFKILTGQGKHAPGGKYDYLINGHMIGGFAFLAWPAQYGNSGIMTFIINQQGKVYQKDLGPDTEPLAQKMKIYDPDPSWHLSPD